MRISFRKLLSLGATHEYYGGACPDLGFLIPHDTEDVLRGGRLIAKPLAGRLQVLFEAGAAGEPLAPVVGCTLRFGLQLLNPHFANFTALAIDPGRAAALYANSAAPRELAPPRAVRLVGARFAHALTSATRPVTVRLDGAPGGFPSTQTIAPGDARTSVSYDLAREPAGARSLEEQYPDSVQATGYYLDPELARDGAFGVVEIQVDPTFYGVHADFTLAFTARQDTLKYYVVASNYSSAEFDQLSVADGGFADDRRPEVTFQKVPVASFTATELPAALLAGGTDRLVLFRSQAPLARQSRGRRKIQLRRNGAVLIEHLPQPGADRADGDLIVHLSKP